MDSSATPRTSDARLVEHARDGGDMAAFELLYQRHSPRVYALCLRMSADEQRARELTHDAFVRAWERLAGFRGEAEFGTWMHRLTVNVVLENTRRTRRREARVTAVEDLEDPVVGDAPDMLLPDVGIRIDLERAIAALPENARKVFVLHAVEGYAHDDIAQQMAIAPSTVRAHLHRARRLLMTWLNR